MQKNVDVKQKKHHPIGCVLDDCPKVEEVKCLPSKPNKFTGGIGTFINELKEDLPTEWLHRFDFTQLKKSEEEVNTWHLPVKNRIIRDGGGFKYYEYPEWCSVANLEKFGKLFPKNQKYECSTQWRCSTIDFYDCFVMLIRGDITVKIYWLQF